MKLYEKCFNIHSCFEAIKNKKLVKCRLKVVVKFELLTIKGHNCEVYVLLQYKINQLISLSRNSNDKSIDGVICVQYGKYRQRLIFNIKKSRS